MSNATLSPLSADMPMEKAIQMLEQRKITSAQFAVYCAEREAAIKAAAQAASVGQFTLKVSEKGAVHIRGIRGINSRFGLALYESALIDIFAHKEEIEKFISDNADKLSHGKVKEE